jgi:molybdate transport system substrate-binding protein
MKILKFILALVVVLSATVDSPAQSNSIRIAAASDVKFALDSLIQLFKKEHTGNVVVTYGSSGKLYEQISNGAPFDIFFSADISYPEKLSNQGLTLSAPEVYGKGRLVIWSNVIDPSILKIASVTDKKVHHVSIANPQHAPYGKRAEEMLRYYKLYDDVKEKLVLGENISQAAQYLYSGAAEVGIIALSLALSPPMLKQHGKYYLIPEESHQPLNQAFVLLTKSKSNVGVSELATFLRTMNSRNVFKFYGFNIPEQIAR